MPHQFAAAVGHTPGMSVALRILAALVALAPLATLAQTVKLSPASRTVYKCEVGGKVTYSDEPCAGAKVVDVEPTRGLGPRVGVDVQRERIREIQAEAMRPITGMSSAERDTFHKRFKLTPEAKRECASLDRNIAQNEAVERLAKGSELSAVQQTLLMDRRRFRELRC